MTSKELGEALKEILPPSRFDDAEFRKSLEDRPSIIDRDNRNDQSQDQAKLGDLSNAAAVDYVSSMEWTEHFAAQDAREACDRQSGVEQEREQDERDQTEFM
jgi:hypothetical protein